MKCAKCNAEVSITDSKCLKCGHDLLQFGATAFYDQKGKDSSRYGQGVKDMVFGGLQSAWKEDFNTLDPDEKKIYSPLANKLKAFFQRHISEEALEDFFDCEVLPLVDNLSKDKDNAELFSKVESAIKTGLVNDEVYKHYGLITNEDTDIFRILRAGEMADELMGKQKEGYDLSIRMFPYFKAAELSCKMHAALRFKDLIDHPKVVELNQVINGRIGNIEGKDIPAWFDGDDQGRKGHRGAVMSLLEMLLDPRSNKKNLINSRNTGLGIYLFGRETLYIRNSIISMNNVFRAEGTYAERNALSQDLCEMQVMRNEKIHEKIEAVLDESVSSSSD